MKSKNDIIEKIVDKSIREILSSQDVDLQKLNFKNDNIKLFGEQGVLDSIGLVSLILAIEENVREELSVDVLLANEKALSQKNSPFKDYQALSKYVSSMV